MHKGSLVCLVGALIAAALPCRSQVLSPPEILDPAMRALQQKHLPELKAAAVDITEHHYPYKFYLSRKLDVTEKQEQLTDQRSILFSNFQGRIVVQVTGNYFAAYAEESMDRNERVERTYLDVMLPILRAMAARLGAEPQLNAFAIEVAHHVRKKVLGVTVENPENVALIIPSAVALHAPASNDLAAQLAVLKQSIIYVDSQPVALWPETPAPASPAGTPASNPVSAPGAVNAIAGTALTVQPSAPVAAPAVSPLAQDLSPEALQKLQTSIQELLDKMVRDLDTQAHFVPYAPPTLIVFHERSYLQLSVTTTLEPSESGSQYRIAALAFDRHLSHLIRPVVAMLQKDPGFDGILFSSTVRIPSQKADSPITQSVEFFLPLAQLRSYAQYDLTGQQLINSAFVLINGERVGLELQSAEGGNR